jgi:hypothetical protein
MDPFPAAEEGNKQDAHETLDGIQHIIRWTLTERCWNEKCNCGWLEGEE